MTIPQDELIAIHNTRELLNWLQTEYNSKTTVREVRAKVRGCTKHYPGAANIESIYKPEIDRWMGDLKGIG